MIRSTRQCIFFALVMIVPLLMASCAQVVHPSGGGKDNKPPRPLKYFPDSAALNFKARNIGITFNEYIQLKDLNTQLIISPPVKTIPDVRVKGKTMNISFSDTLRENTTYTLNFGNSIRD